MSLPPLPTSLRVATLAVVTLAAMVSWKSASEIYIALEAPRHDVPYVDSFRLGVAPEQGQQLAQFVKALTHGQLTAIEGMQRSRIAILVLLSLSATMVFTAALRLRWNLGGARGGRLSVTRQLSAGAVASALFRTLDGAQHLAIVSKGFSAAVRAVEDTPLPADLPLDAMRLSFQAFSIGVTVLVVAGFLLAGGYFRSARVQQLFASWDRDGDED